jgi:FixJ family two-component response regulator
MVALWCGSAPKGSIRVHQHELLYALTLYTDCVRVPFHACRGVLNLIPTTAGLIAVVDDDAATRQSVQRLLQARGYSVSTFESAEEFLESALMDAATALVLDIQLKGMSGIELRRRLSTKISRIPIVFITAHDDDATRREAFAVGCTDYLQKPFAADRLTEALDRGRRASRD